MCHKLMWFEAHVNNNDENFHGPTFYYGYKFESENKNLNIKTMEKINMKDGIITYIAKSLLFKMLWIKLLSLTVFLNQQQIEKERNKV